MRKSEANVGGAVAKLILRDAAGRQVRLGAVQQWIAELLVDGPMSLPQLAAKIREDEAKTRTRLRQMATRGVLTLGGDGNWRVASGPVVPGEPPPPAHRRRRP